MKNESLPANQKSKLKVRFYIFFSLLAIILLWLVLTCFFTVSSMEYVVVLSFGETRLVILEPGLKIKYPWPLETVRRVDNRLLVMDPTSAESLTKDKKNLIVDSFVCYRVVEPKKYLETVVDRTGAESRLRDIVSSNLGASLGNVEMSSLVSITPGEIRFCEICNSIRDLCSKVAERDYGIQVVDFRIKRLGFPEQNKESVFERMRAERKKMATQYRSEGEEESLKIKAQADREKRQILAEANRQAQELKGEGEAEAMKIYSEAIQKDPDFYNFLRTLEAYEKILNEKTTLVLPQDTDLFKLLIKSPSLDSTDKK